MSRILKTIAASGLFLGVLSPAAFADPPEPAAAAEVSASDPSPKAQRAGTPDRVEDRLLARMWWNHKIKSADLNLSEAQRQGMDALFRDYLKARDTAIKAQREHFQAFGDALAGGDADTIRRAGDELDSAMSEPASKQIDMMIQVVALLSPEQREALLEKNPKILSRLWVRASQRLGGRGKR